MSPRARMIRLPTRLAPMEAPPEPVVRLWVLRAQVRLLSCARPQPDELEEQLRAFRELGVLPKTVALAPVDDHEALLVHLTDELHRLEEQVRAHKSDLDDNLDRLRELLGLSALEAAVLSLAVRLQTSDALLRAYGQLHQGESRSAFELMGHMLDEDPVELRRVLGPDGALRRLGFVRSSRYHYRSSPFPMELHSDVEDILLVPHESAEDLLVSFFHRGPRATHELSSFTHLRDDLELLRRVMAGALRGATTGVHVLLYGPPGTGKTELCRALAEDLGATLFEIAVEGRDGDPMTGGLRSTAFRVCQHALARRPKTLVLFDEIEDVFAGRRSFRHYGPGPRHDGYGPDVEKGWMNQLLEKSTVPSFWVTNTLDSLDPAFVRRFDLIVALPEPPVSARRQMARRHLAGLPVDEAFLDKLAHDERITPATLAALRRVAELGGTDGDLEGRLWRALSQRQRALQHKHLPRRSVSPLPWDSRFLQTDPDIAPLVDALARRPSARVLLHGPPGTGKTEVAHELARRAALPLLVRSASDLLSKWVGDTEANLAKMFQEATDTGAVLLLDEADSFFRDRAHERHGYEVSLVNELLTQLERFEGLFLCATNLVDDLDRAAFRRFDLKVAFAPLTSSQRLLLLEEALGAPIEAPALRRRVMALHGLTPGDLAALLRRQRILGRPPQLEEWLSALEADLRLKAKERGPRVGFA